MDLILDTVSTKFQVCGEFGPRLDKDGVQRRDKSAARTCPCGPCSSLPGSTRALRRFW